MPILKHFLIRCRLLSVAGKVHFNKCSFQRVSMKNPFEVCESILSKYIEKLEQTNIYILHVLDTIWKIWWWKLAYCFYCINIQFTFSRCTWATPTSPPPTTIAPIALAHAYTHTERTYIVSKLCTQKCVKKLFGFLGARLCSVLLSIFHERKIGRRTIYLLLLSKKKIQQYIIKILYIKYNSRHSMPH